MANARSRLFPAGALLATFLALPTAAQPVEEGTKESPQSEQGEEAMSPSHPRYASGYFSIGEDFYEGRSSKAELEARVAEMHRNRSSRRKSHLDGLKERWGARLLNHPGAREELRIHARREAYTARALFLAHTDPSVKERPKLVKRIEEMVDREAVRHSHVMESLQSTSNAAPAPSPPASADGK